MLNLDPKTTALVLIDLQKGILELPLTPYSATEITENALYFSAQCRTAGVTVVLVKVTWQADLQDVLRVAVDKPMHRNELPANWDTLADHLQQPGDLMVVKRQWGAFYGTDLDLQLRRRGIKTIVLGGIVTNFGVESTARNAWEHGYEVVIAEDLCSSVDEAMHQFAVEQIFPRISRVRTTGELQFL